MGQPEEYIETFRAQEISLVHEMAGDSGLQCEWFVKENQSRVIYFILIVKFKK